MADDINYLDLLILKKIDADSTVERFGTQINTSFFDTANILGTMKMKGLIDIESSLGGQSPLTITGEGKDIISLAIQKSSEPIDSIDQAILNALVAGVRDLATLQKAINLRSRDLAFHLYKLKAYDYTDHDVRSGKVSFTLTEKGFLLTKGYRSSTTAADIANILEAAGEPVPQKTPEPLPPEEKKRRSIEEDINSLLNMPIFGKKEKPALQYPQGQNSSVQNQSAQNQNSQSNFGSSAPYLNSQSPYSRPPSQGQNSQSLSSQPQYPRQPSQSQNTSSSSQSPYSSQQSNSDSQSPQSSSSQAPWVSHSPHGVSYRDHSQSQASQNAHLPSQSRPQQAQNIQTPPYSRPQTQSKPANLPPFLQEPQEPKKLDKQKMFVSKVEFYIQKYAIFALILLLFFVLLIFAVVFALIS